MVVVTLAALYLGMRANFDPSIGPARLIYAFEAVIIGGLGSLWGTLAGGVILGVAQTLRRRDQSGMADPRRPYRLPRRAAAQAARPVPARGGLSGVIVLGSQPATPRREPRRRIAVLLVADRGRRFAAPLFASRSVHAGPVLHPDHAGAGADLEPARRLCRARLGRPAGLRRLRRLRDVRGRHPRRAGTRFSRSCWRGIAAPLLAIPTAFFAVPPARRLFRHRHLGHGRGVPARCSRSGRRSAAAPAPRCRARPPATCSALNAIRELFGVREAAARDILTYWLALALVVGDDRPSSTGLLRSRQGLALAAVRDNEDAAQLGRRRRASGIKWRWSICRRGLRTGMVRRADLSAEGAHFARRRLLPSSTGRPTSSSSSSSAASAPSRGRSSACSSSSRCAVCWPTRQPGIC